MRRHPSAGNVREKERVCGHTVLNTHTECVSLSVKTVIICNTFICAPSPHHCCLLHVHRQDISVHVDDRFRGCEPD